MELTDKKSRMTRLKSINTDSLAKWLLWIAFTLIILFVFIFVILIRFYGLVLSDGITLLLSSVIAIFAFVEGFSTYLQTRIEKDKNRLQEIKEELEKVYGPLYSIFSKKKEYLQEKEVVLINHMEKDKLDNIIIAYPYLLEPLILDIWRMQIERRKPYKQEALGPIYAIPMYFVSHITIQYDFLTDEYDERVGKERLPKSSFIRRLDRLPQKDDNPEKENQ